MRIVSWRFAKIVVSLGACGFLLFACLDRFTTLFTDRSDPQGGANAWCIKTELLAVPNGAGLIATAHQTDCDAIAKDGAVYVYLQKEGQTESKHTLIFRYFDLATENPPEIIWASESSLRISVGRVSTITKKVEHAAGVDITYVIGREFYPEAVGPSHRD
jgi:hypothetical protein